MDERSIALPGTIIWVAPFYNRSGYGIGARTMVSVMHRAGARIRIMSVNEVESGIDDCDLDLIRSMEKTAVIPPITTIITHVPSRSWLELKFPEPTVRIMDTTFDSSLQGNTPPADWMAVCHAMDQVWVMTEKERNAFMAAGLPPEKIQYVHWPHHWLDNPLLPPPSPDTWDQNKPFRFLSIAMFQPRRRWDTLLEAYFEEFKDCDNVELYLKVNYPPWHPVPGKPRRDLHDMARSLRQKTASRAALVIEEELGARMDILKLFDSCNVYVSTDTAETATISEARVRHRMVILPEGLGVGMPPDMFIKVDPDATAPLTPDMLQYQPHHKDTLMPQLGVEDVRRALRAAYEMPPEQRLANGVHSASLVPTACDVVSEATNAIRAAWQAKCENDENAKQLIAQTL